MALVAVFGSSRISQDSQDYADGVAVGGALAAAGHAVMTGGYDGMMAAISQGAHEANGHVIGVTTAQLEALRGSKANRWVLEQIPYPTLAERLDHLVRRADAYVGMPGGVGTLAEVALAWEYMRVGDIPIRPIVLFGPLWRAAMYDFAHSPYVPAEHRAVVRFADTPADVVNLLTEGLRA